jgi:hypothetical protein
LGWDFDTILDQMTFDRFAALNKEWQRRPPAHWLLASFVGYEPPQAPTYVSPDVLASLIRK